MADILLCTSSEGKDTKFEESVSWLLGINVSIF